VAPKQPRNFGRDPSAPKGEAHTVKMNRFFQLAMTETDFALLEWLADFLKSTKSDAARTAIRSFAAQMRQMEPDLSRRERMDAD